MTNEIKFLFNGIKLDGQLVKGYYSKGNYLNGAIGCFYVKGYASGQSELLRKYFKVENDTDLMTDYFDDDKIYFYENDKFVKEFNEMVKQNEIRHAKQAIKRYEKIRETRPQYFERYCQEYYNEAIKKLQAA